MQQDGTGRILPQRSFRTDYAVTETRRCANFRLRSRHCAASYASLPHLLSWFAHGRRAWKIHGIARPLHNSEKRARYNLAHRAVSGYSAISELAHSLHQTEHGLFRVPPKIRAHLKTSVKRRTFGRSVEEG